MVSKSRIFFILAGCLFLASGIFPWASAYTGSTVERFIGADKTLLYITGGILLLAGVVISGKFAKKISALAMVIGSGWGVYTGLLLTSYFGNSPHFAQNSYYINLGSGIFLILCACILSIGCGVFQLSSVNKHQIA